MSISTQELRRAIWPDIAKAPGRVLACRHCEKKNRVAVPTAVLAPESCECGACRKPLFLARDEPLAAIASSSYEHNLDRTALEALKALPGFSTLLRWLMSNLAERRLRLFSRSTYVECGEEQFPELVALLGRAAKMLDLRFNATLFLGESPQMNAFTLGTEEPIVVVQSALLDQLDDAQVTAVLAHELGHIHSEHTLYRWMAQIIIFGGTRLIPGIGALLTVPLELALLKWSRCAELTCDRAAMLATRDLGACLGVELALAGGHRPGTSRRTKMSLRAYIQQARSLAEQEQTSTADAVFLALMTLGSSHPFAAWRVMHLLDWIEHGNYLDILAGDYRRI